ncbi:MAG: adenylate kinase [Bacteroidia bacterium]
MLNIVLFGPPGAGKGTQSEKLISKFHLVHLSTGDILRSEIAAGTQLGIEAKMLMDAGILVPDEVVIEMIRSKIDNNPNAKGFIFDGFPRTTAQAEALDKLLAEKNSSIRMMLALEVNDQELTKRLLLRGMESGRADDQNESVIRQRIEEYNQKTAPLKQYYSAQNKYRSVNGIGTIEGIFAQLCNVIEPKVARASDEAKKNAPKAAVAKKEAPKVDRPAVKVAAAPKKKKKAAKKAAPKKAAKKAAPKKAAKKAAPKKAAKKAAPKKAAKKAASKKTVKKAAPKKAAKKIVKKVAKKASKKAAPKKVSKKVVKKTAKKVAKKAAPKKAAKKAAPKKAAKKPAKKTAKKKK